MITPTIPKPKTIDHLCLMGTRSWKPFWEVVLDKQLGAKMDRVFLVDRWQISIERRRGQHKAYLYLEDYS